MNKNQRKEMLKRLIQKKKAEVIKEEGAVNKNQRKEMLKRLIQKKKAEVIKEEVYRDYEEGYKKGFITALELLLEENIFDE